MIKSLTIFRLAHSAEDFNKLSVFLRALGFEPGEGWNDEYSRGAPFLAAVGNLEIVAGRAPAEPDILVEVTDLDTASKLARTYFPQHTSDLTDTHWGSRIFTVEAAPNLRLGFWAFQDPARSEPKAFKGEMIATGMRFGIVISRWNSFITERLLQGAIDALRRTGAATKDIKIVRVPGAFEIPSAARTLAESKSVDAVITLGCLIRGETEHYEHIATECTRGIGQSAQETGIPHTYGVLTCENLEQAIDRAGLKNGNKGFEAAISAVEMVSLQRKTRSGGTSNQ